MVCMSIFSIEFDPFLIISTFQTFRASDELRTSTKSENADTKELKYPSPRVPSETSDKHRWRSKTLYVQRILDIEASNKTNGERKAYANG